MIILRPDDSYVAPPRLQRRVREERAGGQAFDPVTGVVSPLSEAELQALRRQAEHDDSLAYFATRAWTNEALPEGCLSSPNRIYLEVTARCNLSCVMCYQDQGQAAGEGELTTDEMCALITRLAALGVHEIRFTGGEPTVRPDLPELLDEALARGLYVSLGTNGVWAEGVADTLLARRLGRVLVSLDGPEELHDSLRGEGMYGATTKTIRRLVAAGQNLRINTVITRRLPALLETFVAQIANLGVSHLALIAPRPSGRGAADAFAADRPGAAEMARVAETIAALQGRTPVCIEFQYRMDGHEGQSSDPVIQKRLSCPAGREAAFISPTGWMHACGCAPGGAHDPALRAPFAAGNVRDLSAAEIHALWLRAPAWDVFRDLARSKHAACLACAHYGRGCFGSCPVHAFLATGAFDGPDPLCPRLSRSHGGSR